MTNIIFNQMFQVVIKDSKPLEVPKFSVRGKFQWVNPIAEKDKILSDVFLLHVSKSLTSAVYVCFKNNAFKFHQKESSVQPTPAAYGKPCFGEK